jgi:uncharacterized protein YndB with AHSA1/START domain
MPRSSEAEAYAPDEVLEITRTFEAPRALVWRLWADPAHRLRWWGPEGFGLAELEMEFKEGGSWRILMKHVSGYEHRVHGVFLDVVEPSRLSFTYINDEDDRETLVTMDFVDHGTKTEMRFRQAPFATVGLRDAHHWGWGWSFDLLAAYAVLVPRVDPRPVGRPRIDGVAADIVAARERHEYELANGIKGEPSPGEQR